MKIKIIVIFIIVNLIHLELKSQNYWVELLAFNVSQHDSIVRLNWTTASESNSAFYYIQRGTDLSNFSIIDSVQAIGNSLNLTNYNNNDSGPFIDTCYYYRLQIKYTNDTYNFTPSMTLCYTNEINEIKNSIGWKIFPNPTNNKYITINYNANNYRNYTLVIYNFLGQEIKVVNNFTGGQIVLEEMFIKKGYYFLKLKKDNMTILTDKIIIN